MEDIRIMIVEDQEAGRDGLSIIIDGWEGFRCVAACPSAEDALRQLDGARPEVVLMDINLPGRWTER